MLRPNFRLRAELDSALRLNLPKDFDGAKSIGIPIRAGYKCHREQHCYGFEKYMQVAEEMAAKRSGHTSGTYDTIVLTSESREMIEASAGYASNASWPFRIVVSANDTLQ